MERISTRRNQKTSGRRFEKMQGKVEICGVNTAKLPILKEEEKEALFARIKAGDDEARGIYQRKFKTGSKCDQTISFQ